MPFTLLDYVLGHVQKRIAASHARELRAYGTSEGASKGWETRGHALGSYKDAARAHGVLRSNGFKAKNIKDNGTGRYAQTVTSYEHPDGHTAVVSRSAADSKSNFVKITSKDEDFHDKIEDKLMWRRPEPSGKTSKVPADFDPMRHGR